MKLIKSFIFSKIKNLILLFNKVKYIFIKDDFSEIKSTDVLLIRSDFDCYPTSTTKFYSPVIEVLSDELSKRNYKYLVITKPFGFLNKFQVQDKALNISSMYVKYAIFKNIIPNIQIFFWRKLIKRVNPRYIICIMPSKNLCQASHDLGIWIADLQHGVISESHPYYGKNFNIYKSKNDLPNCFLVWDENSSRVISAWKDTKNIDTLILGNLSLLYAYKYSIQQLINEKNLILVSLQWELEKFPDAKEIFYKNIISNELAKVINANQNYNWVLRLHPIQQKDKEKIFQYLLEIIPRSIIQRSLDFNHLSLLNILQYTKAHITYSSSVTIEASQLGVPTLLLDSRFDIDGSLSDYFIEEKSSGMAKVIKNNQHIIQNNLDSILQIVSGKKNIDLSNEYKIFLDNLEKIFPIKKCV